MAGPYILSLRIAGAPTDDSITEVFGALSRAGVGSGVPVSGSAISSGDPLGHWQVVGRILCPSATGDAANLSASPYSLTLDNGQIAHLTIEANAWSVSTQAEWDFVIAQSSSTLAGKTIRVRQLAGGASYVSGVNGSAARLRRADYAGLVIRSDKPATPAIFDKFVVRGARNLTIQDVDFAESRDTKFSFIAEAANFVSGVAVIGNRIRGIPQDPHGNFTGGIGTGINQFPNLDAVVFGGTAAWIGDITFRDNHVTWCSRAINGSAGFGTVTISGNRFQYFFEDGINWNYGYADVPVSITDNVLSHPMGKGTDALNPHVDAIRLVASPTATTDWTVYIARNRVWHGDSRGDIQNLLCSDFKSGATDSGHFYVATIEGNAFCAETTQSLSVENAKNCVIVNNTVVREANTSGLSQKIMIGSGSKDSTDAGGHIIERNLTEALIYTGSPTLRDNVLMGSDGATYPYLSVFDGPTFVPETLEDLMAFFNAKVGGAADLAGDFGAGAIGSGAVTWATSVPGSDGVTNAETSPRVTLTNDFGLWGASNISGDQDGTGVTIRTAAVPFITNPTKYLTNANNASFGYSGAPMSTVLTYIVGASAATKAADTILQVAGNNDFGGGSTTVSSAYTTWQAMKAAIGHGRIHTWTAFHASTAAGSQTWCEKTDFLRRASEADPYVESLAWYMRDPAYYPPADATDISDQSRDMIPSSFKFNAGHCDAGGYTVQGERIAIPSIRAFQPGAAPYIFRRELYSTETTNQTNGGFVGNVAFYGDPTGATATCNNANFSVGFVGSSLVMTRATSAALLDDYYDVAVTTSKAGRTHTGTVRVLLGTPSSDVTPYRINHNGAARYAMWEGFSGVADGGKFSMVFDIELLDAAQDATSLRIMNQYSAQGLDIERQASGNIRAILRSGAGTTAINITHNGGTGGLVRAAGGRRWVFTSIDIAAGKANMYIDDAPQTLITTGPGAGATTMGLSKPHRRFSSIDDSPSASVPNCVNTTWWEAADFMDFSFSANRDAFRNSASKAAVALGSAGSVTIAAGAGAGNVISPYYCPRGKAADRYMGRNDGYGTSGSGASKAGVVLAVSNPPARWTTLA